MVSTNSFCRVNESISHLSIVSDRFFEKVERRQMTSLILKVGLEHNNWILSSEVGLPGIGILHRNKIDFVENENNFFVRLRQNFSFNILAPT